MQFTLNKFPELLAMIPAEANLVLEAVARDLWRRLGPLRRRRPCSQPLDDPRLSAGSG
jgi:hypothetical protein